MADHRFMSIPGFWLNGRFYPIIMGGADDGGAGDSGTEGSDDGSGGDGQDPDDQDPDSGSSGNDADGDDGAGDDAEALKKEIAKLRKENAKRRTDTRDAKKAKDDLEGKLKGIAKALGVDGGDEPDVDALKSQLEKTSSQMKTLKVERAISRAARKHSADPDALADSRRFMQEAEALDPDDDNFTGELESLVESAVKNNPKLKTSSTPGKSSGQFDGSGDDGKKVSLEVAVAKGDRAAINKAFDAELAAGRK